MNIIFLDIDGVLNNHHSLADHVYIITEKCKMIERLCKETNSKIVISSTWRIGETLKSLQNFFWRVGIDSKYIISVTPIDNSPDSIRGDEITQWFELHPESLGFSSDYIIIDDDVDFHDHQLLRLIRTNMHTGFCWDDYDKAVALLKK